MPNLRIAPITLHELGAIDASLQSDVQAMLGVPSEATGDERRDPNAAECPALLGAYREMRLVGAVYYRLQAGRVATIWAPRTLASEPISTAANLLQESLVQIAQCNVHLVQSLVECQSMVDIEALRSAGFRHVTDLLYLACPIDDDVSSASNENVQDESSLQFTCYHSEKHDRFAKIVEATYEDSLDCPGVDGMRNIDDVLAGYRATGTYSAERWLIATRHGEDVGCLILTEYEGQRTWELVYMGLLPSARGCRLGRKIVDHAKRMASAAGQSRLVLAVDADNEPAVQMYLQAGFNVWTRQSVMIFPLKNS